MSIDPVLIVATYKAISLFVGLAFGYMGYRLFMTGIEKSAGEMEASAGNNAIKLSRAAPGTFFALFGAVIIIITISQGFDIELPGNTQHLLNKLPQNPPMVTQ